ncbi:MULTISPECIES: hypothetical protein [Rhizobium]|uniref:Uncharacterized protein n=1 Tax=Rhizobium rhododendri TaxID=2506430 RepID=A0ABY8IST5_9HYPH|nr:MULTISPECIES: hypothetical protein [Rhizobium]TQY07838.1 hypothetical protein EQW74_24715 [Rhizobium sp. rho-1.1]WFS26243.1 hypothetical protein PR018_26620 [Rhizobium rhododendri]
MILSCKDDGLSKYVVDRCPKTSGKRIVKASLFVLSDPDVADKNTLDTDYALAIKCRLASLGVDDHAHNEDEESQKGMASATADILM